MTYVIDEAFVEGRKAYMQSLNAGKGWRTPEGNPYKLRSRNHKHWNEGWDNAYLDNNQGRRKHAND